MAKRRADTGTDLTAGSALLDAAEAFVAASAARNPAEPPNPTELLFEAQASGLDLSAVSEPDLRGVAEILGLDELDEQAFLEDAAGWLGRPLP